MSNYNKKNTATEIIAISTDIGELPVGDWEGEGKEVYCEVGKTKIYKIGYKIKMNLKKVDENVYKIKSKYYFSKSGTLFGLEYKKDKLAGSDDFLVNKTRYGLYASNLWYEKDPSSRTFEKFTFDSNQNMNYNYNTNQIVNPLNSYFKKLSSSAGRLFGMQTGKISVSGNYTLKKVEDE